MDLPPETAMRRTVILIVLCAAVAGCDTYQTERQQTYTSTMARPVPTDIYPKIEGRLQAAAPQMSNEEAAGLSARLSALSSRRASGQISEAEYRRRLWELEALAAHHGDDTLAEIRK